jgi:predicted GNAT family acetyltransferase
MSTAVNRPSEKRFVVEVDGAVSELQYETAGGVLDLTHTFVPPQHRGKGLAAVLCDAAFKHAAESGLRVRPSCTYVSDTYLPKHPELTPLVAE